MKKGMRPYSSGEEVANAVTHVVGSHLGAAMLALLAWNRRELCATRLSRIAAGLLAGGIVGNLLDRLRTGRVVDFLDWHWRAAYTFPTFNLADTAICIGVGLLVLASLPCFRARP